jgi:type VI protein secretion system component Hcp
MSVIRATRCGLAVAASAAAACLFASAHLSAQADVIHGCVNNAGALRVVIAGEACKANEVAIAWNVSGPAGATGPAGPAGPQGPAGNDGRDGRDGRDASGPPAPPITLTGTLFVDDAGFGPATPIISFGLGATNTSTIGSGGGAGAGKVDFSNFNLTKLLDGYSLPLLQATATGKHLKKVEIKLFDSGATTAFATYVLTDATVAASQFGGAPTGISESVSFQFAKIESTIVLDGVTFNSCYNIKLAENC